MRIQVGIPAIVLALILGAFSTVVAEEHHQQFGPTDIVGMTFFPFLPHGDTVDGTGPWYGSITIQNIEPADVRIWAFTDAKFDPNTALGTWVLPPEGAITLSSNALGIAEPGSPLVIAGMFRSFWEAGPEAEDVDSLINETCNNEPEPTSDNITWSRTCKPAISGVARLTAPGPGTGSTGNRTSAEHAMVDGYNSIPAQDVAWGDQSRFCEAIVDRWATDCSGVGTYEPFGYGTGFVFDGHSYLPIAQTNSGWNTEIRISNVDPSAWAGQINVTLIASNSQGHAAGEEDQMSFETTLRPGQSWKLNLRQYGVPDEWVGSAHITSSVGVVAQALRINAGERMLMTNVAAPSTWATTSPGTEPEAEEDTLDVQAVGSDTFEMYAPLVFRDFSGWNTGISIASIDEAPTRVTVRFHDSNGQVQSVDTRRIPAQGQEYVYMPSAAGEGVLEGRIGSVTLSADARFHAAVDQVKYATGEAMSYMATAAGAWSPESASTPEVAADSLSLPLMQKGDLDGSGDTSGVQLFNPGAAGSAEVEIWFHSQIGERLPPSNFGPVRAMVPAGGSYTLYAMSQSGMIPRMSGSATVRVVGGTGQVTGVSNNVNYDVAGDGATAFNLVNEWGQYRLPVSQTE